MAELQPTVRGSEDEIRLALRGCDMPFFVFEVAHRTIWLINPGMEELVGLPADRIVGRKVTDFLSGPADAVATTINALDSGFVDASRARRTLRRATGTLVPVWVWSRAVTVGGRRGVVALVLAVSDLGLAGRDPAAPWRSLATVVVGLADRDWRVLAISKDVASLSHPGVDDIVGRSLLELIEPADDPDAASRVAPVERTQPPRRGRLRFPGGASADVLLLFAPLTCTDTGKATHAADDGRRVFALVGTVDPRVARDPSARVQELELHLQRIGAEVRAARIMGDVADLPTFGELTVPDLGDLTTRQWGILSRLVRGERVPQIAADLYLSQSTVRNHLSAIFQKFGVHSQVELLAKLRTMREGAASARSAAAKE